MKTISTVLAGLIWLGVFSASVAEAQISIPSNPNKFTKRSIGEGGGTGSSVGVQKKKEPVQRSQTVVIQYTTVSKLREWTNTGGQKMSARLLAFSAPKEGEAGPVVVIQGGKVRFLMAATKQATDYPLEKLSQPDQILVKAIAQAARHGTPNPGLVEGQIEDGDRARAEAKN